MTAPAPAAALPASVTVTAGHIKNGIPGQCGLCPIALALIEALRAAGLAGAEVSVCPGFAVVASGASVWSAQMPGAADTFIDRFDNGQPVEPFSFDLAWIDGNQS